MFETFAGVLSYRYWRLISMQRSHEMPWEQSWYDPSHFLDEAIDLSVAASGLIRGTSDLNLMQSLWNS